MLGLIVSIIVIGLIAGALARLVVPGRQNMSIPMTIVLGIVGSFVGGFLGYLLFRKDAEERVLPAGGNHRLHHRRDHRAADLDSRGRSPNGTRLSISELFPRGIQDIASGGAGAES